MNLTTQIETVGKFPDRPWTGNQGDQLWFLDGTLKDGKRFKRTCKSEATAREVHEALTNLVGQEGLFELEETDREYKGQREYRLKSYPGQARYTPRGAAGGGGGRSFAPRHRDTAEGTREEATRIARSVALREAVSYFADDKDKTLEGTISVAETFFEWLCKCVPATAEGATGPGVTTGSSATPPGAGVAFKKYSEEIDAAVSAKNAEALSNIILRITASVEKGSVTIDEASELNDLMVRAKKAITSAAELTKWMQAKIAEASSREPLHHNSQMNQTAIQAQEVF